MALYEEYYDLFKKYQRAKFHYEKKLEKKALLIIQTQLGAVDTTKEKINGGKIENKIERFVCELEELDPEIQTARNERDLLAYLLKKKEKELRDSKDIMDRIYVLKYLDKRKARHIAIIINYSLSRTYDLINEIEKKLNIGKNRKKSIV